MLVNDNFKFATKCEFKSKTWFDIGRLIYIFSEGSNEGYRLWVMYSEMDQENFDEFYCYDAWENLVDNPFSESEFEESNESDDSAIPNNGW